LVELSEVNVMLRIFSFLVILIAAVVSRAVLAQLPDMMAIHWNAWGEADGYAPKAIAVWLMPGLMLLIYLLLLAFSGRAREARGAYDGMTLMTMVFMAFVHGLMIAVAMGFPLQMHRVVPFGISLLFVALGPFMPGLAPNPVMGVRTKWTMRSASVWKATHALTGRLFVFGGLALAVASALGAPFFVVLGGFVALALVPVLYSWMLYRRELHS
jgi:uncharacterized membrane protein